MFKLEELFVDGWIMRLAMHGCKELETTVKSRSYNCDVVLDLTTELGLDRKARCYSKSTYCTHEASNVLAHR